MGSVRVAIVGVGNCAASLVQGVEYYRDADPSARVPGLMHVSLGGYHISDIEFVAAFDVDAKKVGFDLSEAILASENNTIKIADVPPMDVTVQRGNTLDGLGVGLLDGLAVVLAETVEGVAALDRHPERGHVAEGDRVVLAGGDRLGQVEADLLGVHVERGHELHVADVVLTEPDVHEARDLGVRVGVLVEVDALDEGRGAVADADDGETDGTHAVFSCS